MINHDPYLDRDATHAALEADARQWRRDRRERIATAALQGMLSNPQTKGWDHEIAARAVRYADALIAELNERENGR